MVRTMTVTKTFETISCPYCKMTTSVPAEIGAIKILHKHYLLKHRMDWDIDVLSKKLKEWGVRIITSERTVRVTGGDGLQQYE